MARGKSLAGLGARYGIKLRKQYTKIHHLLKEVRACPKCGIHPCMAESRL